MTAPEPTEFMIERDYDNGCAHARGMYHMAVQVAENELERALKDAEATRQARLTDTRRTALSAVKDEIAGLPGVGVTRLSEIRG